MQPIEVAKWSEVPDRQPVGALVENIDLVIVRFDDNHSVLFGRCLHRGAHMSDGYIDGNNLICSLHGWDYEFHTGVSSYNNDERLHKFSSWVEGDSLLVDADELLAWEKEHPQPYDREAYQGAYQDPHGTPDEPHVGLIRQLASEGLDYLGHHGPVTAMGVSRNELPEWDDIQFVTAQLARKPQIDDVAVGSGVVIGPNAATPLRLDIPLFVSDMSYGALSEEAKVSLAKGADLAGTGICSGEGGMLPEEQAANSRYFYELASGMFGWSLDKVAGVQAFHFKLGQGAKTGTGGHLPGRKVIGKIAEVRGLPEGQDAISPSTFVEFTCEDDYRRLADEVRDASGGIPIGV
ncbi:MAG: glutamate synthase-related protein, partial [Ilumatobacteraceae bacterium]